MNELHPAHRKKIDEAVTRCVENKSYGFITRDAICAAAGEYHREFTNAIDVAIQSEYLTPQLERRGATVDWSLYTAEHRTPPIANTPAGERVLLNIGLEGIPVGWLFQVAVKQRAAMATALNEFKKNGIVKIAKLPGRTKPTQFASIEDEQTRIAIARRVIF